MASETKTSKNPVRGTIGSVMSGRLFPELSSSHFVPTGLVIAFRDLSDGQLKELEETINESYPYEGDELTLGLTAGRKGRLLFSRTPPSDYGFPFKTEKVTTSIVLDEWYDSSMAGECAYISGSSGLRREIEGWGRAHANHAALYARTTLENREYDRSPEWRREMVKFLDSLPKDTPTREVHRMLSEKDQPKLFRYSAMSHDEIDFLLSTFMPDWKLAIRDGLPGLERR